MSRLFLCGDIHRDRDIAKLKPFYWHAQKELHKTDYLIVAGDFGLLWDSELSIFEKYMFRFYEDKPFTTLFVDGNHENHERLMELPVVDFLGGKAGKVTDHIYHLRRGEVFTINDKTFFTFGGAYSVDKSNRRVYVDWWQGEEASYVEVENGFKNLDKYHWEVDYVITHMLPDSKSYLIPNGYSKKCTTGNILDEFHKRLKFRKWFFGHYHYDLVLEQKYFALFSNVIELDIGHIKTVDEIKSHLL